MSVYTRMFGRHLPCSVLQMLRMPSRVISSQQAENTGLKARLGRADSRELYLQGLWCLSRGQAGLARRHLRDALRRRRDPSCHLALAAACESLGQHDEAAAQIDAVLAQWPPAPTDPPVPSRTTLLCAAGLAFERSDDWQRAAQRYAAAVAETPGDPFANQRLIAIHLAHGHLADASVYLRSALAHHPADRASRICLAHLLQLDGRPDEAIWEYEQALCLEPDTWELPLETARQIQTMQSADQAIGLLERLIASQPHFPDLRVRLANFYSLRGDDDAARMEYRRALAMHPDYLDCHIAMARHELRMARPECAAGHFRDAIAINNQHVEVYAGLAMAQQRSGRKEQSAETLGSAGRIANNSAVLAAQVGLLEMGFRPDSGTELRNEWVEALIGRCETLLAEHPAWNHLRVQQATLLRLLGRASGALHLLREAVVHDSACREAWLHLGLALNDCASPDAAAALAHALRLDQPWARLHYRLGLIYCGELEFELALEKLDAAPDADDRERRIWLAIDAMQMGRPEHQAEADLAGAALPDGGTLDW